MAKIVCKMLIAWVVSFVKIAITLIVVIVHLVVRDKRVEIIINLVMSMSIILFISIVMDFSQHDMSYGQFR